MARRTRLVPPQGAPGGAEAQFLLVVTVLTDTRLGVLLLDRLERFQLGFALFESVPLALDGVLEFGDQFVNVCAGLALRCHDSLRCGELFATLVI